jgi:hypothetical protein
MKTIGGQFAGPPRLSRCRRRACPSLVKCRKTSGARLDRTAADRRGGRRPVDPRKAWRAQAARVCFSPPGDQSVDARRNLAHCGQLRQTVRAAARTAADKRGAAHFTIVRAMSLSLPESDSARQRGCGHLASSECSSRRGQGYRCRAGILVSLRFFAVHRIPTPPQMKWSK